MSWRISIKQWIEKRLAQVPWYVPTIEQVQLLSSPDSNYFAWLMRHKLQDPLETLLLRLQRPGSRPLFSILVPVYNTPPQLLEEAVASVRAQTYPRWELILADDGSDAPETLALLADLARQERRIRVLTGEKNGGISATTNRAAEIARGQWLVLLDHDDVLYADALAVIQEAAATAPDCGIFYSDEDHLSPQGHRYKHNFKPGFSPSLLETHNYVLHLLCIRRTAFQRAGAMRSAFDGSQDLDLLLRLMDQGELFRHVPDILYSWREAETSMVGSTLKPEVFIQGKQAILEHLARRGEKVVEVTDHPENTGGFYRIHFFLPERVRLALIGPGSHPELPTRYQATSPEQADAVLYLAAEVTPYLWEEFLDEMVSWALRSDVGVVGARLLSPDGMILHAGISFMPWGKLRLDFHDLPIGQNQLTNRMRDCLAVHGAALAVSADHWRQLQTIGPLDSATWDLELCLRARQLGWRVVMNPHATALYWGEISLPDAERTQALLQRYQVREDPFLNPHLASSWPDMRLPKQLPATELANAGTAKYLCWLAWVAPNSTSSPARIAALAKQPLFSILMPVYQSNSGYLREMVASIQAQTYVRFEVCVSDDGSQNLEHRNYLEKLANTDPRFRINLAKERGGIAKNTNQCLAIAQGEWLVFCDHDDHLEPFALESVAEYLNNHPECELLYSDEDLMDADGRRHSPHFRPDWNPDMFTSQMYFPHLVVMSRALAGRIGSMDPTMDGAQDYDFLLRATEQATQVGHVPQVLYSWRCHPGSVAQDAAAKVYAYQAGKRALERAMARRGQDAVVVNASGTALGVYRVKRRLKTRQVSHIIEARGEAVLYAMESIRTLSPFPVEIVVAVEEGCEELGEKADRVVIVPQGSPKAVFFNCGAEAATSPTLIFSADTLEVIDSDYPGGLIEHAQRPEIGTVGSRVIYPNGTYYHTGLILGVNGLCGYAHRNTWQGPGYWYYAQCIRNYSAVAWDLMAVEKAKWAAVGGFDETLPVYADVDFCLKLTARGLRHVYTPYVTGVLKRPVHLLEEIRDDKAAARVVERYGSGILIDPHYHPFLSRKLEDFCLRVFEERI